MYKQTGHLLLLKYSLQILTWLSMDYISLSNACIIRCLMLRGEIFKTAIDILVELYDQPSRFMCISADV